MNGDVLTTLDYAQLMRFHQAHNAELTIATHRQNVDIDLGVIESEDGYVTEYVEKPTMRFDVSMGVYVYYPLCSEIPGRLFDFPSCRQGDAEGGRGRGLTGPGIWFDIGTIGEHERAAAEIAGPPGAVRGCLNGRFPSPTWRSARRRSKRSPNLSVGWLSMGPRTVELESKFAAYVRSAHAIASPTARLPCT